MFEFITHVLGTLLHGFVMVSIILAGALVCMLGWLLIKRTTQRMGKKDLMAGTYD